jgi:hypothetical protein
VDLEANFDYDTRLHKSNRATGRFGFWALVSIAVVTGLVVGEVYPMHAFGPSNRTGTPTKLKVQQSVKTLQIFPNVPRKDNAEADQAQPSSLVQKPQEPAQPPTALAEAFVPLPLARPKLQIATRYYYVRTVDQGDADGKLTFRIERRPCKSPNLPPVCFEPLSVRQKTILNDF